MENIKIAKILAGINIIIALIVMASFWGLQNFKIPSLNAHIYAVSASGFTSLISVLFIIGVGLLLNSVAILLIKKE